jgi:CTP synthase (UTP-ammonia lyase)
MVRGIYGRDTIDEEYHCRYGLNPRLESILEGSDLKVAGRDANGEVRAMELMGKTFFVLTQFQPERASLKGEISPVVAAFINVSLG